MKQYFDYPEAVWAYFDEVDARFARRSVAEVQPAAVACYGGDFSGTRAVLWDLYGTLLGIGVGDLEASMGNETRLAEAAGATIDEFGLGASLERLYPGAKVEDALRDRYLALIGASHEASKARGIEWPEVVIEQLWEVMLAECAAAGWESRWDEPLSHTAWRVGYFFDGSLQHTTLYEGAAETLKGLADAGMVQGVISNAQFYTPIRLRRLLRGAWGERAELEDVFEEELMVFSYEMGFSKPNAGGFVKAAEALTRRGIAAQQVVYVGNDMLNDVWGAAQHGWRTVLYAGDERQVRLRQDDERCAGFRPDAIVKRLVDILAMIGVK